jgi:nitroimidazol reductase NimA-like FMN-containing flavoprotein (pyridoxamine 5'-phosphate oxidase superfamily)
MQLVGKLIIKSKNKIIEFLNEESTGRIASIDENGFPQIIPMNFVFLEDMIYMHSHVRGEKIDNIKRDSKVGFEVDKNLEFLPSYFSDPDDASLADTFYISVFAYDIRYGSIGTYSSDQSDSKRDERKIQDWSKYE